MAQEKKEIPKGDELKGEGEPPLSATQADTERERRLGQWAEDPKLQ